uniref:Uncharacterized protein n=1 Tax=Glossina palpalis gambiensis TaxID=67801 RepID=A0A1B0C4P8_9MUSC
MRKTFVYIEAVNALTEVMQNAFRKTPTLGATVLTMPAIEINVPLSSAQSSLLAGVNFTSISNKIHILFRTTSKSFIIARHAELRKCSNTEKKNGGHRQMTQQTAKCPTVERHLGPNTDGLNNEVNVTLKYKELSNKHSFKVFF